MYKESLAPGLSASCQLVLTHTVLLHKPVLQTYPSPKPAEHQKAAVFYSEVLNCNINEGGEDLKEKAQVKRGPVLPLAGAEHALTSGNTWRKQAVTFPLLVEPNTLPPQSPSNPSNHSLGVISLR